MNTARISKIQAKIDKARAKLAEQQRIVKELEAERTGIENTEIIDIVRGLNIPLESLAATLQALKAGTVPVPASTITKPDKEDKPE